MVDSNSQSSDIEQEKITFSYNVIATLIVVLGEDVKAEELFKYLSDFERFSALAKSSCSANLQMLADHGKEYFEQMIVIPTMPPS